jgi:hypothetical protein
MTGAGPLHHEDHKTDGHQDNQSADSGLEHIAAAKRHFWNWKSHNDILQINESGGAL